MKNIWHRYNINRSRPRYEHKYRKYKKCLSIMMLTHFFYKQRFFSTQPQCCLIFSWIEFQMLLWCCLIHISIIITRQFVYVLDFCPCLKPSLFMPYLCDLFFIFIFILIMVNRIISWIQTHLFFCLLTECVLLFLHDNVDEKCE